MGRDGYSGNDYSHRRQWIAERIQLLVRCFAIDVGFHASMSNHLHVVLRTLPRLARRMGKQELARRWLRLFPGKQVLDGNWIEPTQEQVEELAKDKKKIADVRKRLSDVSWFMRCLDEYVARRANREDEMSGRFWQGRFGCRSLETEKELLVCGVYVDLNQLRAGEDLTPQTLHLTSLGCRIAARLEEENGRPRTADTWLSAFTLDPTFDEEAEIPSDSRDRPTEKGLLAMTFESYLQLLDEVRRATSEGEAAVSEKLTWFMEQLSITWNEMKKAARRYLEPCARKQAADTQDVKFANLAELTALVGGSQPATEPSG